MLLCGVVICGCIILGAVEARRNKAENKPPLVNNNSSKDTSIECQTQDMDVEKDEGQEFDCKLRGHATSVQDKEATAGETDKTIPTVSYSKGKAICPTCSSYLRGITPEMVGDFGVCSKCKTEFIIGSEVCEKEEQPQEPVPPPKLEMTVKKISLRALYAFVFIGIVQWILLLMPCLPGEVSQLWQLCHIIFFISIFILLYKIWAIIRLGNVTTHPAAAVFFLFVPIIGIYWILEDFWGWSTHYNETICRYNAKEPRMSELLGFGASTAWFIAFIGFFLSIAYESQPRYYVQEHNRYVRIFHQNQVNDGENVYRSIAPIRSIVHPVARSFVPTKGEYFFHEVLSYIPYLYFDLLMIWFFIRAVECANFLSETHMKIRTGL